MTALLDCYLHEKFPGLVLESPLFYNAEIGIRFEMGDPDPLISDEKYFEQVYYRAGRLFRSLHHDNDDLLLVSFQTSHQRQKPQKIKTFRNAVKDKKTLKQLSCQNRRHIFIRD